MYINTGRGSIDDRPEKISGVFSVAISSRRIIGNCFYLPVFSKMSLFYIFCSLKIIHKFL